MNYLRLFAIFSFLEIFNIHISAQSPFPFGSAPISDLEMTEYEKDKDAPAVYLFDWCTAKLDVNNELKILVERHFRIKILKQDGVDYASFKLSSGDKSTFTKFKASTFNLEDGKVIESPLNRKELYTEKNGNTVSFAFTNVKVGSIIECSYTFSLQTLFFLYPWSFQHSIPVANSEYTAIFPGLFRYKVDGFYGDVKVYSSQNQKNLHIGTISTQEITYKWSAINVPAFEPEPYMASESDYISRVEFELAGVDWPSYGYKEITPTYEKLSEKLMEDENFGTPLKNTVYLAKIVTQITQGLTNDVDIVKAIHKYITQNVKWNERTGIFATGSNFRKVLKNQNGSAADINLLFVAMLQKASITSCPVVLSTRENGILNPLFAIITKFDYVVAYAKINGKEYIMDATDESRPFNELPSECLNGNGRTIHQNMSKWISLYNNEQMYDQVIIKAELGENNSLKCKVSRIYRSYSAFSIRKILNNTGKEGYMSLLKNSGNKEYSDLEIQNQDSIDKSLIINYHVVIKNAIQSTPNLNIINPVLFFSRNENPFSSSERKFPIDFISPENEIYTLNIILPDNMEVDELPTDINLKLDKNDAIFTYVPSVNNNQISLMYRFTRKSTHFPVENYEGLKEFYNKFIKKQSDLIILKKKYITVAKSL